MVREAYLDDHYSTLRPIRIFERPDDFRINDTEYAKFKVGDIRLKRLIGDLRGGVYEDIEAQKVILKRKSRFLKFRLIILFHKEIVYEQRKMINESRN